jgi:hypothetical protein
MKQLRWVKQLYSKGLEKRLLKIITFIFKMSYLWNTFSIIMTMHLELGDVSINEFVNKYYNF